MSLAFNKFNSFSANAMNKAYNLGSDQLAVALCATANTPLATNVKLSDLTQIGYTNLSSRNITTTSSTQTGGVYKLILANLTLTSSTADVAAFQYIVVYDTVATNLELIAWFDYGSAITLHGANGDSFQVQFDQTNGLFSLT